MKFKVVSAIIAAICGLAIASPVYGYSYPIFGGEMIMPEICFDSNGILALTENTSIENPVFFKPPDWDHAPIFNALGPGQEFDSTKPWYVLTGKAHNLQYGPDSGAWNDTKYPFPANCEVWFKVLSQTPGLETYYADGDLANGIPQYDPLFGTRKADGNSSPDIWLWNRGMHHNAYAVPKDAYGRWTATYEVYVGDSIGEKVVDPCTNELYLSSIITYRWLLPCPWILEGDINSDCIADFYDFTLLAAQWLNSCNGPDWCDNADITRTDGVNFADLVALLSNWLIDCRALPLDTACVVR